MSANITTERLQLTPTTLADAELVLELMNTPKWLKYIGDRNLHSLAEAQNYIAEKITPQIKQLGYGSFTIRILNSAQKIGLVGLYDREGLEGIDIGFGLLPEFEKQGYAFEASSKLLAFAKQELNLKNIKGITAKTNTRSQQLLVKLGLQFKEDVILPNTPEQLKLYSWTK